MALHLLKSHFSMFLPYAKLAGYLEEHAYYDVDLHAFFTRALSTQT